ncbi:MAG: hypothetical protein Q8S33_03215 [Myxococcales bacterium]|nr:hypothetical protein [Myxococcales bacterium]MDP3499308.1 hypothetical protein [Myxococcales bacterium]
MAQQPAPERIDDRLAALLETEQRLEARYREAESASRGKLEAAHAEVARARDAALAAVGTTALEEERSDLAAHDAALRAVTEEHVGWLAKLSAVSDEQIDRLARKALARAVATGGLP